MAHCTRPQCTYLVDDVPIVPYPDISGLGVLISFIVTAYMTLILVLIHYLLDCGPGPAVNPIDRGVIDFVWRKMGRRPRKGLGVALRRGVLMFSDQQVVTGIAILSAGYSQLHCGLSSYHWEIVVYLAWFSSVTHLTTLTVLCQYFRDNPLIRNWRAAFMLATVVLLGVALLPTANPAWGLTPGVPAQCFFNALDPGWNYDYHRTTRLSYLSPSSPPSVYMSLVVLSVSFVTRIIELSKKSSVFTRRWMRSKPGGLLKRWLGELNRRARVSGACFLWKLVHEILLAAYVMLKAIFDLNESMLWEIHWLIYALLWGTARISTARRNIDDADRDPKSEEDSWGFGQWIPVLLLMLPLLAMGETTYEILRGSASKDDEPNNIQSPARGVRPCITHASQVDPVQATDQSPAHVSGSTSGESCVTIASVLRTDNELGCPTGNGASDGYRPTGSMLFRSGPAIGRADVVSFASGDPTNPSGNTSYDRDFYQFTWFRVLILFILLLVFTVAVLVIMFGNVEFLVVSISHQGFPSLVGAVALYSLFFVCLDGYRVPISEFLQVLRIRKSLQHKLSPYLPYFVLFCLLGLSITNLFMGVH